MKKICAGYIRVSTHDQEEYSPESQIKKLQEYAKQHEMVLPDELIYRDDGISGRRVKKRTAFQDMIATAKSEEKPFDVILVWKFSRFARNQEESIVYKSMLRKKCGVDVISISEPIMDGPFGSLIERIIEWQDEYYSINLGTEVRRGMAERAGRGLPVSIAPLGYAYQDKALVVVPEEAATVKMIYRDFLSGMPIISIAKNLNALGIKTGRGNRWENRTVRYVLTNPIYIGKIRWCKNGVNNYHRSDRLEGSILVDGTHESIITSKDFEEAQKKIADYLRRDKGDEKVARRQMVSHLLQGLVKCDSCGATMTYSGAGMNCSGYVHGKCTVSHYITEKKLEDLVMSAISAQLGTLDFELVYREQPLLTGEAEMISQRLKREQEVLRRHKEAYASGIDTLEEYKANKTTSEERIATLKETLSNLQSPVKITKKQFVESHKETMRYLLDDTVPIQEKNTLLRSFVDHIILHKNPHSIEISYYV